MGEELVEVEEKEARKKAVPRLALISSLRVA